MSSTFNCFRSLSFTGCHIQSTFWQHISDPTLQCKCIFNCEWLDLGTGSEAARLDVRGINVFMWHKGGRLDHKRTSSWHCMHWHDLVSRSVVPSLTFLMTKTTRYVSQVPFPRSKSLAGPPPATRTHIGRSRTCAAACLGILEITLEARQTDNRSSRLAAPTAGFDPWLLSKSRSRIY